MQRYEMVEGGASKFWEVDLAGTELRVRFGRIGTNGQEKVKAFADAASAQKEYEKLVREKTGKGYGLVVGVGR
jgi:predicted DNA-binding WGR domain protein